MDDKYAALRSALDAVPCVRWTASRATVHIPETEDWAGKDLCVTGLDKQVGRKLARYIADANPDTIRALLADYDRMQDALTEVRAALTMIAIHGGSENYFMGTMRQVREYANQWARTAQAALAQEQGESDAYHHS